MPENPLEVRLKATDQGPNHFILAYNSSHYPISLNPEANVTFSDWLHRLSSVLAGQNDPSGELTQEVLLRNVGTWLWQALFPATAPTQQCDALIQALRSGHSPLLLVLPGKLASLPWELLCDPEQSAEKGFLALHRPLMRLIASDTPVSPIEPPLRVLVLISSPPSLKEDSRVDVESERADVELATREMREAGLLHLLVEDIVTPKRVQQLLMRFHPHIVHYIGHGGYYEKTGGVLLWEDDRGDVLPIYDRRLADILRARNIYAVILHACETGKSNARTDVHGVAGTLVKEGIPAVLEQQGKFTYESSQSASKVWYTALTAGQGFAEALFEVRRALSLANRPDWAVPILRGSATSLVSMLNTSVPGSSPDPLLSSQRAAGLPTSTGVFVGRHRELRAIRLMLESVPGSGPLLALITGPEGIGKSTLAAQAVTRYGTKYKAMLTLSCLGYQSVELFLQRIGEFLKRHGAPGFLEQTLPDPKLSTTMKIEEAITVLNQMGSFLLVVDNLESAQEDQTLRDEGLLQLLQKLLTNLRGGRVLITGRYAVKDLLPSGKFAANLLRLDLDDLSRYETNQLLIRHPSLARLGETVHQTLIDEFGGLPYVYDLLGSDAASHSLDRLVHDVQGHITEERKQHTAEKWQEIRQQVIEFAALEATINRLEEPSRRLLVRLGVLQRPFPLAAIEQGLGATRAEWQPLLDWSLLYYDQWQQAYHLHSITRNYTKDLLNEQDRRQTQAKLAAWYQHYASDESHDLEDYLEAYRLLRASGERQQAGELVMQLTEPLRHFGLYPLLHELCTTTLADIGESDEGLVAGIRHELGNTAQLQRDYPEAERLYQQSLAIAKSLDNQKGQGPDFSPEEANLQVSGFSSENANQQGAGAGFSPENINQQIMQTLVDFVQAPTWEESKRILELHPELLQPEVEAGLQQWAMQQESDGARQSIEEYRRLLIRCGDIGVDAAFAGLQDTKSPEAAFAAALNRICGEVVLALRAGNTGQQKLLANQIEQVLRENLPIEGAADFLQMLVAWLHGQDTQALVEKLQPVFHNAYLQMVATLEQEEIGNIDEENAVSVEGLPRVVSSLILQGTVEQRQQLAEELIKAQQQVMLMEIPLGRFFGCLAAVLRGETPDVASLVTPYTDLWQEFQDALATSSGEPDHQQKVNDD